MMADEQLSPLDRGTLVAWRTFNFVGWSLVALGAAILATWLTNRLGPPILEFALGPVPEAFRPALYLAAGAGIGVGAILGWRLFGHAAAVAAVVAAVHVIITMLKPMGYGTSAAWVFVGPGNFLERRDAILLGTLEIAVAFFVAMIVSQRRPLALRGGRGPQ